MSNLEGTIRLQLDERPGVASQYGLVMKVSHNFWEQPTLLSRSVMHMKAGQMQACHFNDMVMQGLKVLGLRRILSVRLHERLKAGRQNTARFIMEVGLDDYRTYRVTVDPRLDGPEVITRHSPESPMLNGHDVRQQREYVNKAITDVLNMVIMEMAQTRA